MLVGSRIEVDGLIGYTVDDFKYNKNKMPYVKFSIACTMQLGERKATTQWYDVMVYGPRAIALIKEKRITKGWHCLVSGPHVQASYKTRDNITKFSSTIMADKIVTNTIVFNSDKALSDLEKVRDIEHAISDEDIEDLTPF